MNSLCQESRCSNQQLISDEEENIGVRLIQILQNFLPTFQRAMWIDMHPIFFSEQKTHLQQPEFLNSLREQGHSMCKPSAKSPKEANIIHPQHLCRTNCIESILWAILVRPNNNDAGSIFDFWQAN